VIVLLDTCSFLWLAGVRGKASRLAQEIFADPGNQIFLSAVSCWELAVKHAAGNLILPYPPAKFVAEARERAAIETLPLDEEAALYAARLPRLHADPFDRMLICQSIIHGMAILTPDESITQYPVHTIW
jgi:PIN domain nuclease of toxin-antitoxin system